MDKFQAASLIEGFVDEDYTKLDVLYDYCLDIDDSELAIKVGDLNIDELLIYQAYHVLYDEVLHNIKQMSNKKFVNFAKSITDKHLIKFLTKYLGHNYNDTKILIFQLIYEPETKEFLLSTQNLDYLKKQVMLNMFKPSNLKTLLAQAKGFLHMAILAQEFPLIKEYKELISKIKRCCN